MYRDTTSLVLIGIALLAPTAAHAAVVISEVAWMGTSVSANAEWIELQNTGSESVNLSGWILTSATGAPNIALSGSIAGSGYYLLERTSDASVPTVSADQIYSGALANTGLTLLLKDQTGATVDTVVGGTDWASIGGDNTTKQTPQRTGNFWTTADPTPRAQNVTGSSGGGDTATPDPIASTTDPLTPQPSLGGSSISRGSSGNPVPKLYIDAGPGRILTAGADTIFSAYVYDSDGTVRRDAELSWSFGDGAQADGDEVTHAYLLPGTYTVSIAARAGKSHTVSLLKVVVYPSVVRVTKATSEGITLVNDGDELLDMSGWRVVQGDRQFILPRFMALLPGQETQLPASITKLGTSTEPITLLFPSGAVSAALEQQVPEVVVPVTESAESPDSAAEPVAYRAPEQPVAPYAGIQDREDAVTLPLSTINSQAYVTHMSAPSATVVPGALGASVGSGAPELLTSPWTLSFMGLLVAAASILVIL
jgi:hypothetical protein